MAGSGRLRAKSRPTTDYVAIGGFANKALRQGMVSLDADLPYIGDPFLKESLMLCGGLGIGLRIVVPVQHLAVCRTANGVVTKRAQHPKVSNSQRS